VGGLEGGDLGLVRVQVRDEGGARRVDVGLEAFVGVVGKEDELSMHMIFNLLFHS
jgi:hypothetical protein